MQINIDKLGYRWKGQYSPTGTYIENDVVYYNSGTYRIDASGNLVAFALGQQDVTSKGHLLTGGASVGGTNSQLLHSKLNSGIEFRHTDERNGTYVKRLMSFGNNSPHRGGYLGTFYDTPMVIMSDGTVRQWGRRNNDGRHGTGVYGNNSGTFRPAMLPFPKGTVIDKLYGNATLRIAIDTNGHSWSWGSYDGTDTNTSGASNQQTPKRMYDVLPELQNEKIVDVHCGYGWYGHGHILMLTESGKVYGWGQNNYGQLGDGTTNFVYTVKRIGEELGTIKRMFSQPATYGWTVLQTEDDTLWTTGNHSNYGLQPTGTTFQKVTMLNSVGSPVIDITSNIHDGHWVAGSQYYSTLFILHQNGNVTNLTTNGLNQSGWGSQGQNGYTVVPSDPFETGSAEIIGMNGGYGRAFSRRTDGTIWHRGYSGYSISPTGNNTTSWNQYRDYNNQPITNVTKINMLGGHYGSHISALTSDGILYCWGATTYGSDGAGYGSNYNNATTPNGLAPVKIPEKIIDYDVGGYFSSGTGYFTVLALTESNTLYAFGYNSYYASNDFNGHRWTPKRVQF